MKHLDLFSGIGGFALACQWAGIETIGFVEIDKYCQKVLKKHWSNVPIIEDIRDVKKIKEIVTNTEGSGQRPKFGKFSSQSLQKDGQNEPKSSNRIGTRIRESRDYKSAILITAGFPCQPFSVAGKRQGERDDRYLWPETIAVIKAVKPSWVLLENVTGIINLALDTVLSDLEGAGYSTETLIIPACAVNAWHRRDRVWIIGYSTSDRGNQERSFQEGQTTITRGICNDVSDSTNSRTRQDNRGIRQGIGGISRGQKSVIANSRLLRQTKRQKQTAGIEQCSERVIANKFGKGLEKRKKQKLLGQCKTVKRGHVTTNTECTVPPRQRGYSGQILRQSESTGFNITSGKDWWAVEPELGRVAHGIPHRVDRLKCLGNAIVPQVAYEIIKVIKEVEAKCCSQEVMELKYERMSTL